MPPLLYLDTARLGQMTPAAKDAQLDFVRLTAEEPSSLYFEEFLRSGYSAWPDSYQQCFPGLGTWHGVSGLKQALLQLAGSPADWQVCLANRSLSLVNLGVRSQFRVCRNVLTTDLSWPTYQRALEHRAQVTGTRVTPMTIRDQILRRGWTAGDVVENIAATFVKNRCDGLFLPAVDHLGIRLPIRDIVRRIEQVAELRFVFIDAAQAFCQVPIVECFGCADFIVAGVHKWLRAYLSMGIGFYGRRRSQPLVERMLQKLRNSCGMNDPLLDFTEQLENSDLSDHFETANLASLLASGGAVQDAGSCVPQSQAAGQSTFAKFLESNAHAGEDWQPVRPHHTLRSAIELFEPSDMTLRLLPPDVVRRHWLRAGCILSAYSEGVVRVSGTH